MHVCSICYFRVPNCSIQDFSVYNCSMHVCSEFSCSVCQTVLFIHMAFGDRQRPFWETGMLLRGQQKIKSKYPSPFLILDLFYPFPPETDIFQNHIWRQKTIKKKTLWDSALECSVCHCRALDYNLLCCRVLDYSVLHWYTMMPPAIKMAKHSQTY